MSYVSILNGVGITVPLDKGLPKQEIVDSLNRSKVEAVIFEKDYADTMQEISSTMVNSKLLMS